MVKTEIMSNKVTECGTDNKETLQPGKQVSWANNPQSTTR